MSAKKRFGLQRKLVAAATSGEWRNAPLMSVLYEADVTRLIGVLREINAGRSTGDAISFNTVILKIILMPSNRPISASKELIRAKIGSMP